MVAGKHKTITNLSYHGVGKKVEKRLELIELIAEGLTVQKLNPEFEKLINVKYIHKKELAHDRIYNEVTK